MFDGTMSRSIFVLCRVIFHLLWSSIFSIIDHFIGIDIYNKCTITDAKKQFFSVMFLFRLWLSVFFSTAHRKCDLIAWKINLLHTIWIVLCERERETHWLHLRMKNKPNQGRQFRFLTVIHVAWRMINVSFIDILQPTADTVSFRATWRNCYKNGQSNIYSFYFTFFVNSILSHASLSPYANYLFSRIAGDVAVCVVGAKFKGDKSTNKWYYTQRSVVLWPRIFLLHPFCTFAFCHYNKFTSLIINDLLFSFSLSLFLFHSLWWIVLHATLYFAANYNGIICMCMHTLLRAIGGMVVCSIPFFLLRTMCTYNGWLLRTAGPANDNNNNTATTRQQHGECTQFPQFLCKSSRSVLCIWCISPAFPSIFVLQANSTDTPSSRTIAGDKCLWHQLYVNHSTATS